MFAIYEGTCAECEERIRPGQEIYEEGEGWRHYTCPPKRKEKYEGTTLADMGFDE